jgi:PAS domain S-box-containing protein
MATRKGGIAGLARLWANQRLAVKGVVVVALPLAILLVALLSLDQVSRAEARAEAEVRAAFAVQRDLHRVHAQLAEAASGVRGYLLTREERFLEPYLKAEEELPATFARLDAEIRDPEVQRRLDLVLELAVRKREGLATLRQAGSVGARGALDRPDVFAALVANKAILDAMRREIEAMHVREGEILAARRQRADDVRSQNLALITISGAVGLLGSFAAVWLFSTGIVRRVHLLQANAGRLERGETLHPLPAEADEIGGLAVKLEEASHLLRTREQALREGEERFRLVVEGVRDYGIFALDVEGRVVSWNAGAERIFGWRADQILGRGFAVLHPEPTRATRPAAILSVARNEGRAEDEGWRVRSDGSPFWANVVVTALLDEAGRLKGFSKVMRDMTDRRKAEQALSEAREAAVAASIAKSEFLSRTSHELRTPLSGILGFAQLLELDQSQLGPRQASAVQQILKAGRNLQSLINEVLDIASIESGRLELHLEPIDLREPLREALDLAAPIAAAAGITLERVLPDTPMMVTADRRRVVQVALNLLSNAIKYNRPAGRTRLVLANADGRVRVEVIDEGGGVPAALASRLFTPFDRLGREKTSNVEGTGLGLAHSLRLVEAMAGAIGFHNRVTPMAGAVFWFELPPVRAGDPIERVMTA